MEKKSYDHLGLAPLQTIEAFSLQTGLTVSTITHWVHRGLIPTHKIGKRVLINLVQLRIDLEVNEVKNLH